MVNQNGAGTKEPGVQSIRRAFFILESVASSPNGLTLSQLSRKVGLHSSTTFHLTKTMVSIGALRQDEQTKAYHIGAGLFGLARAAVDEAELVHIARPALEKLALETGESSYIGVLVPEGVVTIDRHEGAFNIHNIGRIGNTFPAHATAMGKAILAALPEKQLLAYLRSHPLKAFTAKTIVEGERLREDLVRAREAGYAYGDTEFNEDLRSLAAPAFDFTGRVVGGIGIVGPIWRIKPDNLIKLSESVKSAALEFSRRLGADRFDNHGSTTTTDLQE